VNLQIRRRKIDVCCRVHCAIHIVPDGIYMFVEPFNHPAWNLPESEMSSVKQPIFIQTVLLERASDNPKVSYRQTAKVDDLFQFVRSSRLL
jgi:hypothetical protein